MFLLLLFSLLPGAPPLQEGVQMETLANGMRILVLPQGEAPVAAFHLLVRAGSRNEPPGKGGLAHLAEHLVFHGSDRLGSRDWSAEQRALRDVDEAWKAWQRAREKPSPRADAETLAGLRQQFLDARAEAGALGDPGAFDRLIERAGGRDQNASTDADTIRFTVSLPSNRAEQWFWLMRELIRRPVMRGFYAERDVVEEERRMKLDSNPLNALLAKLYASAFPSHPYGRPVFGSPEEIAGLDRNDLLSFWRNNVVPRRMVLVVVGSVEPAGIFRLAREYFGPFRAGSRPSPPPGPQTGAGGGGRVELARDAQPLVVVGWHLPAYTGRRRLLYRMLAELLDRRLEHRLIEQDSAAVRIDWATAVPGRVDPSLLLLLAVPYPGRSPDSLIGPIQEEVDRLAKEGASPEEMEELARKEKMAFLRKREDPAGMARALADAEAEDGGWRFVFQLPALVDGLASADLARAAGSFRPERRLVGLLRPPEEK